MFHIAIDGPAGAGKSTIAKLVAKRCGIIYVDTGAMYRSLAYACLLAGVRKEEQEKIAEVCRKSTVELAFEDGSQIVKLNGENVNSFIRTEEVGNMTSAISVYPEVRAKLLDLQRSMAEKMDLVMDGRDIGTNVLPNAALKVYLTASSHTRALRRCKELTDKGTACDIEAIERDIMERDDRDMHRAIAPLRQAEDAVYLDSSYMTIEEVAQTIMNLAEARGFLWK